MNHKITEVGANLKRSPRPAIPPPSRVSAEFRPHCSGLLSSKCQTEGNDLFPQYPGCVLTDADQYCVSLHHHQGSSTTAGEQAIPGTGLSICLSISKGSYQTTHLGCFLLNMPLGVLTAPSNSVLSANLMSIFISCLGHR